MYNQNAAHQQWLTDAVTSVGGVAGTVHIERDDVLHLTAALRIPEPVIAIVASVPNGKGMAGLAMTRKVPVQTCDLQTDNSGDVRPGAKAVNAQAAIAVPVFGADQQVVAVVGFAWMQEGDLSAEMQEQIKNKVSEFGALLETAN